MTKIEMLDTVAIGKNCPGFNIYEALATDGNTYVISADYPGSADTRLFFATNGAVTIVSPILDNTRLIGVNPAVAEWEALTGF